MKLLREIFNIISNSGRTGIVSFLSVILPVIGGSFLLIYAEIFGEYLRQGNLLSIFIFVILAAVLVGTSLLPSQALALAGGWVYGFSLGLTYTYVGICSAALIGYSLSRVLNCDKFSDTMKSYERFDLVLNGLKNERRGYLYSLISLMRLSPVIPFAMTNVMMASLRVPLRPFFVGTFIGMLPRTALMVFAGAGLTDLDFSQKSGIQSLAIGAVATILVLVLISRAAQKILDGQFVVNKS